ncbi:MAG: DUF632 domain-containing protein [Treponema sp.]|jgi:vacuolar-type H+-ATPase subunit H|nr:DUF632 domain-containing protein [Treponema sp.]
MEELQSTETLDREILEDARKKAFKILKGADDSAAAASSSWEKKLRKTGERVRGDYEKKIEKARREILARLPLDKRRIRSEKIEAFLAGAIRGFLASLDRGTLLRILQEELSRLQIPPGAVSSGAGEVRYRGLSAEELDSLFQLLPCPAPVSIREDPLYTAPGDFPALIIDFPRMRITASVDQAAEVLLLDKRAELTGALLGAAFDEAPPLQGPLARAAVEVSGD